MATVKGWLRRLAGERRSAPERVRSRRALVLRQPESLEARQMLSGMPFGAMPDDTGEYMLGDITVTVVLMESDPSTAPPGVTPDFSTEDWTPALIQETKAKVNDALAWWKTTLAKVSSVHADDLNFVVDYTYADNPFRTWYEPINRKSNDFSLWMYDFLDHVGHDQTGDFSADIRAYNHAQRLAHDTNWSFTIFVVNSTNDPEDAFASGGTFSRAFSFAGGRFIVVPSGRPTSTFTHEVGHMFWARDEYSGEDWTARRGYYDTQNSNAARTGYTQIPTIMSSGQSLQDAFDSFTSAPATLAMIGWQDSDGDGIFDVLDVPLTLTGSGFFDPTTNTYRFQGASSVQTLPNRNSSGLQNDITINRVSRAEYRVDGGAWATAATYNAYSAELSLSIPVGSGAHTVEIRTIDAATGVTSPIFSGSTLELETVLRAGINGSVYQDVAADGGYQSGDPGLSGWSVQLVTPQGTPLVLQKTVEPDSYSAGSSLYNVIPEVLLSAVGGDANGSVLALATNAASTGGLAFGSYNQVAGYNSTAWTESGMRLRMDFPTPTNYVSLDAIGNSNGDYARLELYDSSNRLLARYTTSLLTTGQVETMHLEREQPDVAYAIARGHLKTDVHFDNLKFGPRTATTTDAMGGYFLTGLPSGSYTVRVEPPASWSSAAANPPDKSVAVTVGQPVANVDFGAVGAQNPWHNEDVPTDVDDDGSVVPLDALIIINDLNSFGARDLRIPGPGPSAPPPYLDVDNNYFVTPMDVLLIINRLNQPSGGEGSGQGGGGDSPFLGGSSGDGEFTGWFELYRTTAEREATAEPTNLATLRDARQELLSRSQIFVPSAANVLPSPDTDAAWLDTIARDVARQALGQDHDEHEHSHDEEDELAHEHEHAA